MISHIRIGFGAQIGNYRAGLGNYNVLQALISGAYTISLDHSKNHNLSFGFQGGYSFGNDWSMELEYNTGSEEVGSADLDVTSMGLYGVYRSAGQAYFLGKIGMAKNEVEISGGGFSAKEDETGLAYGLGGGYNIDKQFGIEAEYNIVDSDISIFAVTGRFMF